MNNVGKRVYWDAVLFTPRASLGAVTEPIKKQGIILAENKASVTVLLSRHIDPYCTEDEHGSFYELPNGRWTFLP